MRKINFQTILFAVAILFVGASLNSCKKKCTINKEDTHSGAIIYEKNGGLVVVMPLSGYMTSNVTPQQHLIQENHTYADRYEVSFDGGVNKGPVDYNIYSIVAYPLYVTCEASLDREVIIDNVNQKVIYNIKITECANCNESYLMENYVLIPKVPIGYELVQNPPTRVEVKE